MPERTHRPRGQRRRETLLRAALEVIAERGIGGTTHRAVAQVADVPVATTTYYFSSLDELVTAAVERTSRDELAEGRAQLDALGDGPPDTPALVGIVLDQLLGPESRDGGLDAVLLRYERLVGAGRRPYLAPLMRELRTELDALLGAVLARSGHPLDAGALDDLVALVDGKVISALIEADPDPRAAARGVLLRNL